MECYPIKPFWCVYDLVVSTGQNGTIGYTLDKVGNREVRTSSVGSIPSISSTFNNRDWLSGDSFDLNGNTLTSTQPLAIVAQPDVYDFEDRLIIRHKTDGSSINFAYDADGLLRSKTVLDLGLNPVRTTQRLIDTNNLTGYAQVVEEYQITSAGTTAKIYTYGSDLISQSVSLNSQPSTLSYFGYDGLGSVRTLTDVTGTVTDTWDYDAFGNTVARTGTTDNAYLYRGEQYDADLGMYYLRARFYNQATGRFWNQDSYEGSSGDPASLHKYLYANGSPLMFSDPSGHMMSLGEMMLTTGAIGTLAGMAIGGIDAHLSGGNVADGVINGAIMGGIGGVLSVVPGLGPVVLTAGSFMGGWSLGSAINEGNASLAAFRAVTTFGAFGLTRINGIGKFKIPLGLKDEAAFFKFGARLSTGLKRAGYSDATSYMRGSSVTGGSKTKGPFDVGRTSDYDLSITSEALLARAKQMGVQLRGENGVKTRTGPLTPDELSQLGLAEVVNELSANAGRKVSIMIYEDASWIAARGEEFLAIE